MIDWFATGFGGVDKDLEMLFDGGLAGKFSKTARAEGGVELLVLFGSGGRRDHRA